MTKADVAAVILLIGATLYALFGGADFGGGLWDLIAGDAERGERPRERIQRSLTPVWEANHVWLIFILVVLWTSFPEAFGAIMSTLYVPLALAALGIVLRGAGFAFRKSIRRLELRRAMGATFAISSVLTPFFMGTVVGAIAAGNVPAGGNGDAFSSWIQPLPILTGALFVATGAYLAAVFLVADSRGAGDSEMEDYFARRALAAGLGSGALAAAGLVLLHSEAHYAYERLTAEGLPLVIVSGLCGLAALVLLATGNRRGIRPLAVGAVVAVIWGWGVSQFPYLLPTSLKISQSAAPDPTLVAIIIVFIVAVVVVLPSLGLLFWLSQKELLDE
ncbi:MAG TPA: cytochrome d ubiquinol oxidase subunit II [Solirubrobacterales bacterium]|jgi:cytochrome d ubiquinol oxidase subunit II|nr:cytochrome d ubiquinol oxidase subunit II [Solirubrobacterales bacterium]